MFILDRLNKYHELFNIKKKKRIIWDLIFNFVYLTNNLRVSWILKKRPKGIGSKL